MDEITPYELDFVPDKIDDIRYCILDYSDPANPDCMFVPLVFLEIFSAPAAVLQIGEHTLKMPMEWNLIITDSELTDHEVMPITSLNDRGFSAFTLDPVRGFKPEVHLIEIVDIYQDVKWHFPKMKKGHMLAVPLDEKKAATCAFFVSGKEANKIPAVLDNISDLW